MGQQPIEEWGLAGEDFLSSGCEREPGGAVDLGEFLHASGFGRPLHGKQIAPDLIGGIVHIAIDLDCPRADDFAARLAEVAKGNVVALGWREAGFFMELTFRGVERIFPCCIFAFGQ